MREVQQRRNFSSGRAPTSRSPIGAVVPSITALRTLEAAAYHLSFSKAAEELDMTQSGVSRAIRSIEDLVGVPLFERTGHGLVLTEPGADYFGRIRELIGELEAATRNVSTYKAAAQALTVATLPTFGSRWLASRVVRFVRRYPEIRLNIVARIRPFSFEETGIDAAIHYGTEAWPGALSELLMEEILVPVYSPSLLKRSPAMPKHRLLALPLIQHTHRPNAWREWFKAAGVTHPAPNAGVCFEQYDMGIHAALGGLGAALIPEFMIRDEIESGLLIPLSDVEVKSRWAYYFVYPEAKRPRPSVQKFRAWLRIEAQKGIRNEE